MVIVRGEAHDHRHHQTRPRARLDETLVDHQIDTAAAIDGQQVARRPNQHIRNCVSGVSGVRASLLKHALEPLPAFLRFGGHLAHHVWVCGDKTKPLGTKAASPNNFSKSPLWTAHATFERCKLKPDLLLPTLHVSLDGETDVISFNLALLRDVLDAVDASNAYVHFSECLVDAVLRQQGGALAPLGNSVFRVAVHCLNEDFLETWHEQGSAILASWQQACRRCRRAA